MQNLLCSAAKVGSVSAGFRLLGRRMFQSVTKFELRFSRENLTNVSVDHPINIDKTCWGSFANYTITTAYL